MMDELDQLDMVNNHINQRLQTMVELVRAAGLPIESIEEAEPESDAAINISAGYHIQVCSYGGYGAGHWNEEEGILTDFGNYPTIQGAIDKLLEKVPLSKTVRYYATYREGNQYPIILVEFEKGKFRDRTETKTGESFTSYVKAMNRTGELNIELKGES